MQLWSKFSRTMLDNIKSDILYIKCNANRVMYIPMYSSLLPDKHTNASMFGMCIEIKLKYQLCKL